MSLTRFTVFLALMLALAPVAVTAQEFSPRAYWPAPVGTKLLISGYSYSSGDVLLDPTIPIYGVDSRINTAFFGYMQTFALAGRNANLVLEAPYSWGVTRWLLELDAGAWLFGDDDDYPGGRREQDPIYAFEAHLVHRFRPGLWVSLDANWYRGGQQTIGGEEREDVQKNVRLGATVAVPFGGRHALKFGFSTAARTRYGSDSEQLLVSYSLLLR